MEMKLTQRFQLQRPETDFEISPTMPPEEMVRRVRLAFKQMPEEGKENLQGEVEGVENFYYARDGLHFVYNPYEIACGATGAVEVVIDPKTL